TIILCAAWLACVHCQHGQQGPTTTPVPILKQINRQNDDGSYSYGYEAADGSFKIETKYPSGDVAGKYGYVDESGKLREISYGASSKRGFEPQGQGIMVPPPTLNDPSNALTDGQEDDGQYREDP
ncbi:PREDICTED: endocuticle structural glycoprotein SgAbd-3-like, partial [Papilio polytes]